MTEVCSVWKRLDAGRLVLAEGAALAMTATAIVKVSLPLHKNKWNIFHSCMLRYASAYPSIAKHSSIFI